jgi:hypothetical protein
MLNLGSLCQGRENIPKFERSLQFGNACLAVVKDMGAQQLALRLLQSAKRIESIVLGTEASTAQFGLFPVLHYDFGRYLDEGFEVRQGVSPALFCLRNPSR